MSTEQFDFWQDLNKPKWMNTHTPSYLTLMGSRAYGTATPDSDYDFYGFVVPPAEVVFPHLAGDIPHFGKQKNLFNQLQIQGQNSENWGEADITVYNIARYFHLVMEGNPNMIDSLFTPDDCVMVLDNIGQMVRDNRKIFLSQKMYHTFRGMAYHHMKRITSRTREGKRKEYVEKYGYDVKDAANVIRILLELDDFLFFGDCDLSSNADDILSVRNGEWTLKHVEDFFDDRMFELERAKLNKEFVLPEHPDQDEIKKFLVACLEESYGNLRHLSWGIFGD